MVTEWRRREKKGGGGGNQEIIAVSAFHNIKNLAECIGGAHVLGGTFNPFVLDL